MAEIRSLQTVRLVSLVLGWSAIALGLIGQGIWANSAFVRPHRLLHEATGKAYWLAITTKFENSEGLGGGAVSWNLKLPEEYRKEFERPCAQGLVPLRGIPMAADRADPSLLWCPLWTYRRRGESSAISALQRGDELYLTEWFE